MGPQRTGAMAPAPAGGASLEPSARVSLEPSPCRASIPSTAVRASNQEYGAMEMDGYAAMENANIPIHGMIMPEMSLRLHPAPLGMPLRHMAIVACGILALVVITMCCGLWLGVQLGTQAIAQKSAEYYGAAMGQQHVRHRSSAQLGSPWSTTAKTTTMTMTVARLTSTTTAQPTIAAALTEELRDALTIKATTASTTSTGATMATAAVIDTTSHTVTTHTAETTSQTKAVAYYPSLFCFCIMRHDGYELSLVRTQLAKGASIFSCDAYTVYSDVQTWITPGPPVRIDTTVLQISLAAAAGVKEHILNTQIFLQAWEHVRTEGKYRQHEWIAKVDPDAVFFPRRLRDHLTRVAPAGGANLYLLNCRYSFGLFGALEVFSRLALDNFYDGLQHCKQVLPWETYGEDMFMRKCLDYLEVDHKEDYDLLSDGYCNEPPSPCVSGKVAFHPFKNVETYLRCMDEAVR